MSKHGGRVTSSEVAAASGVSRTTVSYVLNGTPGSRISEQTRVRVLEVAESMGHIPNAAARRLRAGKSWAILALIPNTPRTYVVDTLLQHLDRQLFHHGYTLIARRHDPDHNLDELRGTFNPDLIVALAGVQVPPEQQGDSFVDTFDLLDHRAAGRMAAEYLLGKGHRRFGYLYPVQASPLAAVADLRWTGFVETLEAANIAEPQRYEVDPELPDLSAVVASLRTVTARPSAIMCHNDIMAGMLIQAMSLEGMTVPRDLAVMGHDDIPVARLGISTIAVDVSGYAQSILREILFALSGHTEPAASSAALTLVPRASA
ncbi:MAG: LacI family DNA-binding transcriptional regulator [Rhodoglobus sp.]